jgi:hypothetical protein
VIRLILLSVVLIVSSVGRLQGQGAIGIATEKAKKEILELEDEKVQAILKGNSDAADYYDRYDVDDIAYPYPNGSMPTKAEHIKATQTSERKILTMKEEDLRVRVYGNGNVAVVTAKEVQTTEVNGKASPRQALGTTVYVKQDGTWRRILHTAYDLR